MKLLSFWCSYIILLFCSACKERNKEVHIADMQAEYKVQTAYNTTRQGDIILRSGKDELSKLFAQLNTKNKSYSHCGVAFKEQGQVYVYHIIRSPNEGNNDMQKELLSKFINPKNNDGFAIIRNNLTAAEIDSFCNQVLEFYKQEIRFDTHFDLATDDKMYCSEMIFKAILKATKDPYFIEKSITQSGKKYIAIDNLFDHKNCKTICEVRY